MPTEYNKMYYLKNREKRIKYGTNKINCSICGVEICRNAIYYHQKTENCKIRTELNLLRNKISEMKVI